MSIKSKYLSSAFLLLFSTVIVKLVGAIYKIPLTSYIGAVGRGYFAYAYNLCMPIHIITMGVFPTALSKLVSQSNGKKAFVLFKSANRLFAIIGIIGMLIVLAVSKPYTSFIAHSPKSIYTILAIAPSILFSCMASSYRGYYEGSINMVPTAVSQLIEAVSKMIFGLLFARASMARLYVEYQSLGTVCSLPASCNEDALSLMYPITSAYAIFGVTFGAILSYTFLVIYRFANTKSIPFNKRELKPASNEILAFSFPIMISSAIQSVFQFLDTASVQLALNHTDIFRLKAYYSQCFKLVDVSQSDIPTYLYGIYSASLDLKNLVPGITMALGVCAVPTISKAFENKEDISPITNSIIKYTLLISCFGGFAISLSSYEMLNMLYSSSMDIVLGAEKLVVGFGLSTFIYSVAGVVVYSVQAIGCARKSIMPFIASGAIRIVLNYVLVRYTEFNLIGVVISGAIGYLVITIWNLAILIREARLKIQFVKVVVKPLFVSLNSLIIGIYAQNYINFSKNFMEVFLIKVSIFCVFFCILCICLRIIDINELLSVFKKKKLA